MSSAVNVFVHAIHKRSQKCLTQKVARFGLLGPIPMIQPPFNSSFVALQYEPGAKFFHSYRMWPGGLLHQSPGQVGEYSIPVIHVRQETSRTLGIRVEAAVSAVNCILNPVILHSLCHVLSVVICAYLFELLGIYISVFRSYVVYGSPRFVSFFLPVCLERLKVPPSVGQGGVCKTSISDLPRLGCCYRRSTSPTQGRGSRVRIAVCTHDLAHELIQRIDDYYQRLRQFP